MTLEKRFEQEMINIYTTAKKEGSVKNFSQIGMQALA